MIRKGRFDKSAAEIGQRYSESMSFDWRLYRYDICRGDWSRASDRAGMSHHKLLDLGKCDYRLDLRFVFSFRCSQMNVRRVHLSPVGIEMKPKRTDPQDRRCLSTKK